MEDTEETKRTTDDERSQGNGTSSSQMSYKYIELDVQKGVYPATVTI